MSTTNLSNRKMDISSDTNNVQSRSLNFECAFRAVLYFSRAVGMWPFSIVRDPDGSIQKCRVRPIDVLWFLSSICFYLMAAYHDYTIIKLPNGRNETIFFIYSMLQMMSLSFGACAIGLDMINRNQLVNILEKFNTFDNRVGISTATFNDCK